MHTKRAVLKCPLSFFILSRLRRTPFILEGELDYQGYERHYNTALSQEILLEGLIYPFKAINP